MKSLVQKISLNQQDLNVEPVSPGLWELCITAGQIYMFTSDNAAENKIFSSGRSQFFKKKKKKSFRIIAKLCTSSLQPGDRSPRLLGTSVLITFLLFTAIYYSLEQWVQVPYLLFQLSFVQKNLLFPIARTIPGCLEVKRFGNRYKSTLPPPTQWKLQNLASDTKSVKVKSGATTWF